MPTVLNKHKLPGKKIPVGTVYVGRPSKWGNPYVADASRTREQAVQLYEMYLDQLNPELADEARVELKGKDLVCYCAPKPCHADVLLRIANEEANESENE